MGRLLRGAFGAAATVSAALVWTGPAGAVVTCNYQAATKHVQIEHTERGDRPRAFIDGSEIVVKNFGGPTVDAPCAGGTPTTTNTDSITMRDRSGKGTTASISGPSDFAPGATAEPDSVDEIEFRVRLGQGRDRLSVDGPDAEGSVHIWGTGGLNANFELLSASPDADVMFSGVERVSDGHEGDFEDSISGGGGLGTGGPLRLPMTIASHDGDDMLSGGAANDRIDAGGDGDTIAGGAGRDTTTYEFGNPGGINVTIGSGSGDDGSSDDGPPGSRDTVQGDVENVIGSGFPDLIAGNSRRNVFVGNGGADVLRGFGGRDLLKARDGAADTEINCGPGLDRARLDAIDPPPSSC